MRARLNSTRLHNAALQRRCSRFIRCSRSHTRVTYGAKADPPQEASRAAQSSPVCIIQFFQYPPLQPTCCSAALVSMHQRASPSLWDAAEYEQQLEAFSEEHKNSYGYGEVDAAPQATGDRRTVADESCKGLSSETPGQSEISAHGELRAHGRHMGPCRRQIDVLRSSEFTRLGSPADVQSNTLDTEPASVYLDYGGAALYSERQVHEACQDLSQQLLCNPHRCGLLQPRSALL